MKLLAVDTSNKVASVALFQDDVFIEEKRNDCQLTHSETLLPLIDELLKEKNITIKDIDMFAVCIGPGSFTGIRIGVATVKGMAQALNKKIISVTSLEGLLEISQSKNACAIINARHGNVYMQIRHKGKPGAPDFMTIEQLINELKNRNEKFEVVGDATEEFENLLKLSTDCKILEGRYETSSNIGKTALNKYATDENEAKIPHEILPIYLRKAQPDRSE